MAARCDWIASIAADLSHRHAAGRDFAAHGGGACSCDRQFWFQWFRWHALAWHRARVFKSQCRCGGMGTPAGPPWISEHQIKRHLGHRTHDSVVAGTTGMPRLVRGSGGGLGSPARVPLGSREDESIGHI